MVGKKLNHRITISLDEDTFDSVTRMAVESHVSIGWVVRYAVDYLLKAGEEGKHSQLLLPFSNRKGIEDDRIAPRKGSERDSG